MRNIQTNVKFVLRAKSNNFRSVHKDIVESLATKMPRKRRHSLYSNFQTRAIYTTKTLRYSVVKSSARRFIKKSVLRESTNIYNQYRRVGIWKPMFQTRKGIQMKALMQKWIECVITDDNGSYYEANKNASLHIDMEAYDKLYKENIAKDIYPINREGVTKHRERKLIVVDVGRKLHKQLKEEKTILLNDDEYDVKEIMRITLKRKK